MTTNLSAHRTRRRARTQPARPAPDREVALVLDKAAARAIRQRSVTASVRAAWDVLVTSGITGLCAISAWQHALGCDRSDESVFPAACLACPSPADVAASLAGAAKGAIAA